MNLLKKQRGDVPGLESAVVKIRQADLLSDLVPRNPECVLAELQINVQGMEPLGEGAARTHLAGLTRTGRVAQGLKREGAQEAWARRLMRCDSLDTPHGSWRAFTSPFHLWNLCDSTECCQALRVEAKAHAWAKKAAQKWCFTAQSV